MWSGLGEYFERVIKFWWWLLAVGLPSVVALLALFLGRNLLLPAWGWGFIALGLLAVAQFLAFLQVRNERQQTRSDLGAVKKQLADAMDAQSSTPGVTFISAGGEHSRVDVDRSQFVYGGPQPTPTPDKHLTPEKAEALADECEVMAKELNAFFVNWKRQEPPWRSIYAVGRSREEMNRMDEEYRKASFEHSTAMSNDFQEHFRPQAIALRDELASYGMVVAHWEGFNFPTNSIVMEGIIDVLATAARRLRP